jgi:WD40 repeat protein
LGTANFSSSGITEMIKEKEKLLGHRGICWNVSWSPDSQFIASCGQDKKIMIWKVKDRSFKCVDVGNDSSSVHTRTTRRTAWRSDSGMLASCSFDSTASVWAMTSDEKLALVSKLSGQESEVKGVCFSPCGEMLATCSRDKSIWVFDVSSLLADSQTPPAEIHSGDFSPRSLNESRGNEIDVECLAVLQGHSQDVKNVIFNPTDSHMMVSVSYDDCIKIWRSNGADDWELSQTLKGHSNTVWDVCFNPSKTNEFATVSADGSLRIWFQANRSHTVKPGHSYLLSGPVGVSSRQFNDSLKPVGEHGWSCQTIQITSSQIAGIDPFPVYCIDWSRNSLIAVGCGDNTVRIFFRDRNSTIPLTMVKTTNEPNSVSFKPSVTDVVELAVGFDDGSIIIYEIPCSELFNS